MKTTHIALVVSMQQGVPVLIDTLTDHSEIEYYQASLTKGESNPLGEIYSHRDQSEKQDAELADYIEEFLSKPFPEIGVQQQATKWLRVKMKLEQSLKKEKEAARVIADYAYRAFVTEPERNDFFIESSRFRLRVRVFTLPQSLAA
jgi:hypothetical protein